MNQIAEKARELAKLLGETSEYKTMRRLEELAGHSAEVTEIAARYQEKRDLIELMTGEDQPDFDKMAEVQKEMEEIEEQMGKIPLVASLRQSRAGFQQLMGIVNHELQHELFPETEHECGGECDHCGGECHHHHE